MKFKAYGDIVVLKRDPKKKMTESGIFLPDQYDNAISLGTVESGGPHLAYGSRVLYNSLGTIEMNGYDLIHKQAILAVIIPE